MPEVDRDFLVGTRGWDFSADQSGYYPDDLPAEWRLSYYANDFFAVLVPWEQWGCADKETLSQWVDDVHERFRFFLEMQQPSHADAIESARVRLNLLGPRLAGLLLGSDCSDELPNQLMADREWSWVCYRPVACPDEADAMVASRCWGVVGEDRQVRARLIVLDDLSPVDLRQMKDLIGQLVSGHAATDVPSGLFLRGDSPDLQRLVDVKTLAELMGLA